MGLHRSDPEGRERACAGRLTAIFSKRPEPGRVKTRLCPPLDPEGAALLAEAMLRDAVERCAGCPSFRTTLAFAPAADATWFRRNLPELTDQVPQVGAHLGERLSHFFAAALERPENASVVAIGSDQPLVSTRRIAEAHERLEAGADLVLGPDPGGGYYLVGLCRAHAGLFLEVEMSSPGMFDETLCVARGAGLAASVLEEAYDVDVEADLVRLRSDLRRLAAGGDLDPDYPRHTARRLAELYP